MKIINVPIEPLEERYSTQWDKWFSEYFRSNKIDHFNIYGETIYGQIRDGSFLDVVKTNVYKLEQLRRIIKQIDRETDEKQIIFFHDLWFPGLEMLAYIRDGLGLKNLKICGCLHAGTYDPNDFLAKKGMDSWGEDLENSWFQIVDKIFVATDYHAQLLLQKRKIYQNKIVVTGFPIYAEEIKYHLEFQKEDTIVFPHRLDEEKRPDLFDQLAKELNTHKIFKDWSFVKTKDVCKTKQDYYSLLARSKIAISFAEQETWGIAMQEAVFNGCFPLVPNRLSYPEMYTCGGDFLYNDWTQLIENLESCAERPIPNGDYLDMIRRNFEINGKQAIPNMIDQMKTL